MTACGAVEKVTTTCSTVVALHDLFEIPAGAEHGQALVLVRVVDHRVLVEEPDRTQPELRAVAQTLGDQVADAAGTDDQRVEAGLAAPQRAALVERDAEAAGAEEDEREGPQPQRLLSEQRVVGHECAQRRSATSTAIDVAAKMRAIVSTGVSCRRKP